MQGEKENKTDNSVRVFEIQPLGHPKHLIIDGQYYTPATNPENVRSVKLIEPRDSDIFICTYAKCGTTWLQHIVAQLVFEDYSPAIGRELNVAYSAFIEFRGARFVDAMADPRVLKSHSRFGETPRSPTAKYIVVCRNPKDCLTSYYYFYCNLKAFNWSDGDFNIFFELFMSGQLCWGSYFDHLLSWMPHFADANVLMLRYEDLCENLQDGILKIANFLGGRAAEVVKNEVTLNSIVEASQFDSMKKIVKTLHPIIRIKDGVKESLFHDHERFLRKGITGDWRHLLNYEQSNRMDVAFAERMKGTIAGNWWKHEMAWVE